MRPTHTYLCTSNPRILTHSAQLPLRFGPLSHFNNTPPLHPPLIRRHINPQPTSSSKPTAILSQASPIPAVGRRFKAQKQSSASQVLKSSTLQRHRQAVPTLPSLSPQPSAYVATDSMALLAYARRSVIVTASPLHTHLNYRIKQFTCV